MIRHRSGAFLEKSDDESSSDDDVFCALSRKRKIKKISSEKIGITSTSNERIQSNATASDSNDTPVINIETSSNKRHHHQSSQRAANMDAVLQELKETPVSENADRKHKLSDKMGSYCLPGEEDSTTNIFVGANLSPLTTEEQLTDIFRQFGDLYSVKIMWPRTPEEEARGRNSGFVCFMNRDDAQDAMDTLQGTDPLNNGRKMFLNWGRNVKKVVKRGAGGVPIPPIRGASQTYVARGANQVSSAAEESMIQNTAHGQGVHFDPKIHLSTAIRVIPPSCPARFKFISTVASFVAKDGSGLEEKLIDREKNNPAFSFIHQCNENPIDNVIKKELIFYRWRVFAFKNGEVYDKWRVEPFAMIQPHGRFWIPPPIDPKLSEQKKIEDQMKEEQMQLLKKQRRNIIAARKGFAAGRLDNSNVSTYNMLTSEQLTKWNEIVGSLTCSREAICEAMAFCFDHSVTAQHISRLLKDVLLDSRRGVSIETKFARLFLMSDILFNSQQGVKNAFRYRDAIEEMAPEVFKCLGQHENGNAGRITMNKLRATTRKVLNAWDSWSVYNPIFLDELELSFEGKSSSKPACDDMIVNDIDVDFERKDDTTMKVNNLVRTESKPSSIWMDASKIESESKNHSSKCPPPSDINGESLDEIEIDPAALINEDLDGESLGESEIFDSGDEE